jgi:hypothetical protein
MLTKKIANFSDDLLNTVRGILGEAKKCPADCECEKCEAEDDEKEMKEGSMPTADEPTDANKKTADKVRAMMAKEKKPVKEDAEQIDEISSDMAHRYLKGKRERDYDISPDGKSSKLKKPQSFGKMNKDMKSTVRALKTIEKAKKANEDVEHTNCGTPECCGQCDTAAPINEVSKGTLGRYINKAKDSIDMASYRQGHKEAHGSSSKPLEKKLSKRHKGISTAVSKLTKEDAEQIDELSKKTLGSYVKKASGAEQPKNVMSPKNVPLTKIAAYQGDSETRELGKRFNQATYDKAERLRKNRSQGITRAADKLAKEEVEVIDELSKKTLGSYVKKATNQAFSRGYSGGAMTVRGDMNRDSEEEKAGEKNVHKAIKRVSGVTKAVNKLTKEEQDFVDSLNDADIEQIDELSKKTVSSYLDKSEPRLKDYAHPQVIKRHKSAKTARSKLGLPTGSNRGGYGRATTYHTPRVTATEETEITEARGRPRKAGAKDFTIHPKTKEKLMHNNPADMARIERLQKNGILEKPKVEAGQHIMNQLQKAKTSMLGGSTIHFTHGDSKHVSGTHAAKLLSKYAGMKPNEKEDFQKKIGHSHENLMKHV